MIFVPDDSCDRSRPFFSVYPKSVINLRSNGRLGFIQARNFTLTDSLA